MTIAGPARPGLAWPAGCCCGRPLFYDRFVMMKFKRHFLFFSPTLMSSRGLWAFVVTSARGSSPLFPPLFIIMISIRLSFFFFIPAGRPLLHSINRRAPFDDKTLGLQVAHFDFDFKRRRKCFKKL
jgi:hypothetical protein